MLKTAVKVLGFGSAGIGSILLGNHYYVHSSWQSQHPLIQESINLVLKDTKIARQIGANIERDGGVSGVLDPDKKWATANFKVSGDIKANISVVADAKDPQEGDTGSEYFSIGSYPRPRSSLDAIYQFFGGQEGKSVDYVWKIVSLTVKFDDMYAYNVIGEGLRSHKELRESEKIQEMEDDEILKESVGSKRRKHVYSKITNTYWKMFAAGMVCIGIGVYSLRFTKQFTVKNGMFWNKALEILKTDEFVRKEIGIPLHSAECIKGYLNFNKTKGNAMGFIYGPYGWAKLHIIGNFDKKENSWNYSKILVTKDHAQHDFKDKA